MTRDEITALMARRREAWPRRDVDTLAACHLEDGVVESPLAGGVARGREAIKGVYRAFFDAFTETEFRPRELVLDGTRGAQLLQISGIDSGGFLGMAPTGRSFSVLVGHFFEFRDGGIAHERRVYDFSGLLIQIGTLKVKPH